MSVYMCTGPEEARRTCLDLELQTVVECSRHCWEPYVGPLQEHPVLLTTKAILLPQYILVFTDEKVSNHLS